MLSFASAAACVCNTFSSTSQRATRRTPGMARYARMWVLPCELKPTTATRMSELAPIGRVVAFEAVALRGDRDDDDDDWHAERSAAAAVALEVLRNCRRFICRLRW